jgi:hypothetical protein
LQYGLTPFIDCLFEFIQWSDRADTQPLAISKENRPGKLERQMNRMIAVARMTKRKMVDGNSGQPMDLKTRIRRKLAAERAQLLRDKDQQFSAGRLLRNSGSEQDPTEFISGKYKGGFMKDYIWKDRTIKNKLVAKSNALRKSSSEDITERQLMFPVTQKYKHLGRKIFDTPMLVGGPNALLRKGHRARTIKIGQKIPASK